MIKAIIFDLDHTLFDRYKTLEKIVDDHFDETMFKPDTDPEIAKKEWIYADKNFIHFGFGEVFEHLQRKGIIKDGVTKGNFYSDYILPLFMKVAVPFDFTIPTLEELRRSYKIGLITNGKHDIQSKKIEMLGFNDLFDEIMISDDYGVRKPDTKLFEIMAEKLGIAPAEMLYVGDHPKNDVDASRNAGYTPVWVKTTGTWIFSDIEKPKLQIETVAELPELLETQASGVAEKFSQNR